MQVRLRRGRGPRAFDRTWALPLIALAAIGCQDASLPTEPEPGADFAAAVPSGGVGADDWIVVFRDDVQDPPALARRLASESGATVRHVYSHALRGFAATIPPQAIEGLRRNPNVDFVEPDGVVTKTAVGSWGLDRIDQRALPLDGAYAPTGDGTGVDAWIIDTGIDYGRTDEFGSRFDLARDYDFVSGDDDASDCDGHGTHVAGTVGSATYGVAKDVTIIGVRVLNCRGSGTWSGVIAGIDHVAANADGPTVANMSLGGGYSSAVNAAVANAVSAGVVMAVSAGNSSANACNYSPASTPSAITVASSTSSDARSSFSNYGSCVDLFAPGSSITSTRNGGGTATWSGTSMASPHVAGAAALLLEANPGWSPSQVWTAMQGDATSGVISSAGSGTPNLLLHVASSGGGGGDPDPGCGDACPPATIGSVSDVTVTFRNGNRAEGSVTVLVLDGSAPLAGAVVSGSWTVNGIADYVSSTGTTGSDGTVELVSGAIRGASTFSFCVTGVTASGYTDGSSGECSGSGGGGDPTDPPTDPPAGAPADLTAASVWKGPNARAELAWTGGGTSVDVYRDGAPIATGQSNNGSFNDNLGKDVSGSFTYSVCNAGSTTECSGTATASF